MNGLPLPAPPTGAAPAAVLSARLDELHRSVSNCLDALESWGAQARHDSALEVHAKAETLRRQLRPAIREAAALKVEVRALEHHPGVPRFTTSPVTLAVVTAASSLHAAMHAMSPAAAGLCLNQQVPATVETSLTATRRFLRVAGSALLDAVRLLHLTVPEPTHLEPGPHLSVVPASKTLEEMEP